MEKVLFLLLPNLLALKLRLLLWHLMFHPQVLVMTPQVLLRSLCHCFIRMEMIALLIFDECHYAQIESNHPYAEIMKVKASNNRNMLLSFPPILGWKSWMLCDCLTFRKLSCWVNFMTCRYSIILNFPKFHVFLAWLHLPYVEKVISCPFPLLSSDNSVFQRLVHVGSSGVWDLS